MKLTLTAEPPFFSFPLPSSSPFAPVLGPLALAFFLGGMTMLCRINPSVGHILVFYTAVPSRETPKLKEV